MHGLRGLIHITVMTMANGTTVNAEQLVKLRKRTSASGNTILFLDYVSLLRSLPDYGYSLYLNFVYKFILP